MFLDPEIAKPLSACGLAFVDEPTDVLPALVAYVGGDARKIGDRRHRSGRSGAVPGGAYVTVVPADRFIDEVSQGKYCAAIGYSGDVFLARDGAAEAKKGKISYYVPAEGSQLWFDLLVIPTGARNVDAAYAFLDFLLKPEIAAANTNHVQYANANTASAPYHRQGAAERSRSLSAGRGATATGGAVAAEFERRSGASARVGEAQEVAHSPVAA